MSHNGVNVGVHERSDHFASFFADKIDTITVDTQIDPNVYNGTRKLWATNRMFKKAQKKSKTVYRASK